MCLLHSRFHVFAMVVSQSQLTRAGLILHCSCWPITIKRLRAFAIDCDNLFLVFAALKSKYKRKQFINCADKDHGKDENTGIKQAKSIKEKLGTQLDLNLISLQIASIWLSLSIAPFEPRTYIIFHIIPLSLCHRTTKNGDCSILKAKGVGFFINLVSLSPTIDFFLLYFETV